MSLLRTASFTVALVLSAFGGAASAEFDLEKTKRVLEREVDGLLTRGTASVSIALVREGEIVWTAAYGHSNVFARTKATPETIYVTGSTFKAVTATALMQLVERGKIALDDRVNDHLSDTQIEDDPTRPVTIRHLLSHVSGLQPGANTVGVWDRELPMSLEELTSKLRAVRPPEEKYEYNNYAYGAAGYLIEQVTGVEYEAYVLEHILQPLGVETAGPVRPTPEMVERMALPYFPTPGGPRPVAQTSFDVYPAGDIYLTASDMARFLGAHLNGGAFGGGRILTAASVAECHRHQFFDYGLGWGVGRGENANLISHGGGVSGFTTTMIGDLEAKVGAYVMSNSGDVSRLGKLAIRLLRGEEVEERKTVVVAPEKLEAYVGEYRISPRFTLTVTHEGEQLFVQGTNQNRHELFAVSDTKFFLKAVEADVTFDPDQHGAVDRLVLRQGGDHVGRRIE